ncbi:histidinol-phosphate transaminase [Actinospica sp.]|uniref:histidinol-phosphate transaminase n=1 Tax=Actinospica sp. TaxID=1872142 RepID=UPI002B79B706|nr:histidinol-phosphate transaminase [Actinospica sp.]HWG25502.1 histidinol-phosphate transaminase [Actinospica sp.]
MAEISADSTSEPRVRLRAAIAGLPAYKAGKPPAPFEGTSFKLASNENPYPPLPGVLKTATAAAEEINRYPDFGSAALIEEIASFAAVPAERVAVGTGSVGVLQQLMQVTAGPGDEVLFAWRSFEAYPIVAQIAGATAVTVPLRADETHDLDAMADAVTERTRLILVCNPNNPTGAIVLREELERFLDRVPEDVLVVLDEAYIEFVRDEDYPDGVAVSLDRSNVCVLRTFSKAYGLAGLRIGYAIAAEPVATALRACAVPFGVNLVAQAAAVESLRSQAALMERVDALVEERTRVLAALREIDLAGRYGVDLYDSQANFVWLRLGERSVDFAQACEAIGVTVRPYAPEGVRVTIGEQEANDRVLDLLRSGF